MYSDLYKMWKAEKSSTAPNPLSSDFYQQAQKYLKSLDDELASANTSSLQGRLLTEEKEIAGQLLYELRETRLRKIILGIQSHIQTQPSDLTEEEIAAITNINKILSSLNQAQGTEIQHRNEVASTLTIVRFIQDIPEIVGVDLKIYGPFKKEDVASLPLPNAQALERQGAVKVVELKNGDEEPFRQK